jgi:restriction endonuclease S subunit
MSDEGRKQILLSASTTSGLYTLSTGKIAAFELPVPSLALQMQFLALTKQTDKSKFEIKKAIENTSALIKSLMQQNLSNLF